MPSDAGHNLYTLSLLPIYYTVSARRTVRFTFTTLPKSMTLALKTSRHLKSAEKTSRRSNLRTKKLFL